MRRPRSKVRGSRVRGFEGPRHACSPLRLCAPASSSGWRFGSGLTVRGSRSTALPHRSTLNCSTAHSRAVQRPRSNVRGPWFEGRGSGVGGCGLLLPPIRPLACSPAPLHQVAVGGSRFRVDGSVRGSRFPSAPSAPLRLRPRRPRRVPTGERSIIGRSAASRHVLSPYGDAVSPCWHAAMALH